MNNDKRILVIDDESQTNNLNKIATDLKGFFSISFSQIMVLDEKFFEDEELTKYDIKKLENNINVELKMSPNIVLVDYDYGQEINLDGLSVIKIIRGYRKHIPIILYSADQKKVIENVVGKDLNSASTDKIVDGINSLMDYKIEKMCKRNSYEEDVVRLLKSNIEESPKTILCHLLRDNGDRIFNSCCPELKGKTFSEIADLLEEKNNGRGNEWLNAILQQVIAYLTEVNE